MLSVPTDIPDDLGLSSGAARLPAELEQQAEVIAHGTVTGDLVVGDGEDVDLFAAVGHHPYRRSGQPRPQPAAFHEGPQPWVRTKLPVHRFIQTATVPIVQRSPFRGEGAQRGQLRGIQ